MSRLMKAWTTTLIRRFQAENEHNRPFHHFSGESGTSSTYHPPNLSLSPKKTRRPVPHCTSTSSLPFRAFGPNKALQIGLRPMGAERASVATATPLLAARSLAEHSTAAERSRAGRLTPATLRGINNKKAEAKLPRSGSRPKPVGGGNLHK